MKKRKWCSTSIAISLFLLIVSLAGCTPGESGESRTFRTYKDKDYGFSISYPRDWEIVSDERISGMKIVAFWNPRDENRGKPVFTLAKDNRTAETNSQSYFEEVRENLELAKIYNYSFLSKDEVVVDSMPAIKHIFNFDGDVETLASMQVYVAQSKSVWIMTLLCAPEHFGSLESTFDAMVSSFHLF